MGNSSRMVAFVTVLFSLLIGLITLIQTVKSMAYDVAKLNTKMNKMKATLTRHNTKEQSIVKTQALLPKFIDKAKNAVGRLHEEEYTNGFATFELLVRRTQTGPWYRYQDLMGTEATNDFVENVILGGLEAEAWRMKLDNWISMQVFGKGTGGESIKKVKETLIQFKKLKPREFEFGYRIAVDGETVYSVEKSMKEEIVIPKSRSPSMARVNVTSLITSMADQPLTETRISLKSKWLENEERINTLPADAQDVKIQSSISMLNDAVLLFYDRMVSEKANGCLFFSDGSATLSEDGLGCATACCGIYLLPTKDNIPIYDISESIRVDSAGGMIDSPFDAELIAGLSAVTVAKLLAKIISKRTEEEHSDTLEGAVRATDSDADASSPSASIESIVSPSMGRNKIEFTLHTDSKTLCRAIRTGPKGDLADRASPSRLALWKLLSGHMGELLEMGLPMLVDWIPGHPERRDQDRNRWTVRDIGIWMADEIAKIEGNEVTAGFVNRVSKDSSSNNNKLAVRPVEKVAKFPKKVALKSPKKTGVKKKNYYNTKLTFSKDPRNPNAIASATAAGTLGAEVLNKDTESETALANEQSVSLSMDDVDNRVNGGSQEDGIALGAFDGAAADEEEDNEDGTDASMSDTEEEETPVETGDEMEDVDVLQLTERSDELSTAADDAPTMMPVAVIAAVDMIRFSTLLMP